MSNEPNKPIPAQELTEKELEGIVGGGEPSVKLIAPVALDENVRFAIRAGGRTVGVGTVSTMIK